MVSAPTERPAECVEGDATAPAAWRQALRGRRADALITDPPYCILTRRRRGGDERDPKGRKLERGPLRRFDTVRQYQDFTNSWLSLALQHLDPAAPLIVFTNLLGKAPLERAANALGLGPIRGEFVWAKHTRDTSGGERLLRVVETALVWCRVPSSSPSPADLALPWAVTTPRAEDPEAQRFGGHPSFKPRAVLEPLIRTWTRPAQLVVDPFSGSGSIAHACLSLARRVAALEVDPEWVRVTNARLADLGSIA